jgi:hypothetical protein
VERTFRKLHLHPAFVINVSYSFLFKVCAMGAAQVFMAISPRLSMDSKKTKESGVMPSSFVYRIDTEPGLRMDA